ncbi:MAG: Holliday junction branch migration protein RuvA [Planctomycetota bacterium]|jgi:Holliday junction DNA helicase RuvA
MYDHIRGEVCESQPARVVLRAGGVGFELKVPVSTSTALAAGTEAELFTILHVVDGNPTMLGFQNRVERELARRLLTVSGVGPSMTLAILSSYSPSQVAEAILSGDAGTLKSVKGVGSKTAERLCLELRDHVAKLELIEGAVTADPILQPQSREDAVNALITLGYSEKDAREKVKKAVERDPEAGTESIIKLVLRG